MSKYKTTSMAFSSVALATADGSNNSSGSASASATASTGSALTSQIEADTLSSSLAYTIAYKNALQNLDHTLQQEIILLTNKNSNSSVSSEYIYTIPQELRQKNPFALYYTDYTSIQLDDTYNLLYENEILSSFQPNFIFSEIITPNAGFISNVTVSTINPDYIFVSLNPQNEVYRINKNNGLYSIFLDENVYEPVGLEFDNNGLCYVANFLNSSINGISVFDQQQTFVKKITSPLFYTLGGIKFDKTGRLFALNGLPIPDPDSPYYNQYLMLEINIATDEVSVFCFNTLNVPLFLCFDENNYCYVTNYNNDTISRINMLNGEAEVYINDIIKPRGIDIDGYGNLYVSGGDITTTDFYVSKIDPIKNISVIAKNNLNDPRGVAYELNGNGIMELYIGNVGNFLTKLSLNSLIFLVESHVLYNGIRLLAIVNATTTQEIDTVDVSIQ